MTNTIKWNSNVKSFVFLKIALFVSFTIVYYIIYIYDN